MFNLLYLVQANDIIKKFDCTVKWLLIDYGVNAGDSRDVIDSKLGDVDFNYFDEVENHFCTIEPRIDNTNYVIFNSAVPDQDRPYVEKHFVTLLKRLEKGYHVELSCTNQQDLIPPLLKVSTSIYNKFFNPVLFESMFEMYFNQELYKTLMAILPASYFFPFRLSDSCYKVEEAMKLGKTLIITDPNESSELDGDFLDISYLHICKKTLYMTMLQVVKDRDDIRIPLYEDITKNYHIGIVEMLYFCASDIDFHYLIDSIENLKSRYILDY